MTDIRDKLLSRIDDGDLDQLDILKMCLKYMSWTDIEQMLRVNDISLNDLDDRLVDFDYEQNEIIRSSIVRYPLL